MSQDGKSRCDCNCNCNCGCGPECCSQVAGLIRQLADLIEKNCA